MSGAVAHATALSPATAARAGLVSRGGAFTTDLLILAMMDWGIGEFLLLLRNALPRLGPRLPVGLALLTAAPLLFAVYHVAFWLLWGATPGQWLFGLEVVSVRGGPLRVAQACARVVAYAVSALPFYAGFLWVLLPGRLTWHDRLVGTAVVYRR